MKLLLDHCLDWRLRRYLTGHAVKHVGQVGWGHLKNGALLTRAQQEFDALITSDKNLPYQQNLARFNLAIVILDVPSNRIEDCVPKITAVLEVLTHLVKGRAVLI